MVSRIIRIPVGRRCPDPRVITDIRFIRSRREPPASNRGTIRHAADSLRMFYRVGTNLVDHVDGIRHMADGSLLDAGGSRRLRIVGPSVITCGGARSSMRWSGVFVGEMRLVTPTPIPVLYSFGQSTYSPARSERRGHGPHPRRARRPP